MACRKMLVLTANKTKMIRLAKAMGYNPPKKAAFSKAYRDLFWWLEWDDNSGYYSACFSASAGRAFFGMRYTEYDSDAPEKWNAVTLSVDDLKRFDMVQVV